MHKRYFGIVSIGISFFNIFNAAAATMVGKVITSNEIWTAAGSPFVLTENTAILNGASVTVMPGVEIRGGLSISLTVHGGFSCFGKADSMIAINGVFIQFNSTCPDYNPVTGKGTKLLYTSFKPASSSNYSIFSTKTNLLIDNCLFESGNYGIYSSDTVKFWIYNSRFKGNSSYPIQGMNIGSYLEFVGNTVDNLSYFYLAEKNIIKNNYFYGWGSSYGIYPQSYTQEATIECNYFRKLNYAMYFTSSAVKFKSISVQNNKFDSCNYVLYLYLYNTLPSPDSFKIHKNNFTNFTKSAYVNATFTGAVKQLNMADNFWGTTDTNVIKSGIYDNRTVSSVKVLVNYNTVLSSPVSACWPTIPSNLASIMVYTPKIAEFTIVPNPGSSQIKITSENEDIYFVEIMDLNGKICKNINVNGNQIQLSVSDLRKGMYLVKLITASGSQAIRKLIVE